MQILNLSSSQQVTSNFELPCGGKVNNFDEKKLKVDGREASVRVRRRRGASVRAKRRGGGISRKLKEDNSLHFQFIL